MRVGLERGGELRRRRHARWGRPAVDAPTTPHASSVFDAFADAGVEVRSYDCLNHGASAGEPRDVGLVPRVTFLVDDMRAALATAAAAHPGVPLFAMGHSMGGLIALLSVLGVATTPGATPPPLPTLAGLILSSAAVDVEWTPLLRIQAPLGGLLAALAPRARIVPAVDPSMLSPDPACVAAYVNDPLNFVGPVRARTGNELLKGFRAAAAALAARGGLDAPPLLAIHGDADRCTSLRAVKAVVDGAADGELVVVPGGFHELLHGATAPAAIKILLDWTLARARDKVRVSKM